MILYDPRSSRAVPDTVAALGRSSDLSRVGHAFFKRRMRDAGAIFGGEVSGHYYFRDFYCADSGSIPALLMLELLSTRRPVAAELMAAFRSRYFISGEINPRSPTRRRRWTRSRSATRTARSAISTASRSTTRTGISTSAPRTPSRCCA